jgi:RNA polymerase sigma-70 factor, ECF subfamily
VSVHTANTASKREPRTPVTIYDSFPDGPKVPRRASLHRRTARRPAGPAAPATGAASRAHGERRPRQQSDVPEPSTIVAGIRRGDHRAATEMVTRYEKGVRHVLTRLIANPADRDDLTQDVWVVALTRIRRGELRSPDLLFGFLTGTARGLALNERRRNRRRATEADSEAVEAHPAEGDDPAEVAERAEFRQVALRAICTLRTPLYREVLLRSVANHDRDRTCAELGIGVLQYRGVLCKAKGRLKKVIKQATAPDVPQLRDAPPGRLARMRPEDGRVQLRC